MTAITDIPSALIQPVSNALLKKYHVAHAIKAISPTIVFSDGSGFLPIDNNDDGDDDTNKYETSNTIPYTMGPML